ncbi:MAG: hypothetical protein QG668_453 [Patescibacteria group bacterium]|nr:hypothetical protein [Patescibacteria group bacterium]
MDGLSPQKEGMDGKKVYERSKNFVNVCMKKPSQEAGVSIGRASPVQEGRAGCWRGAAVEEGAGDTWGDRDRPRGATLRDKEAR